MESKLHIVEFKNTNILEVTNSKGKCSELLFKVKKVMEQDVHVCHMYSMANKLLQAWQISAIQER